MCIVLHIEIIHQEWPNYDPTMKSLRDPGQFPSNPLTRTGPIMKSLIIKGPGPRGYFPL